METKEMIEVMQAYVSGKTIECKISKIKGYWSEVASPSWDWACFEYRIKPGQETQNQQNTVTFNCFTKEEEYTTCKCLCGDWVFEETSRGFFSCCNCGRQYTSEGDLINEK